MSKYLGIVLIVLALVVAVFPQFADCQSQGKDIALANGTHIPMRCHWTARAELAMGISILVVGVMMIVNRRKETIRNLSIAGVVLGILAILLPTSLIGVCATPTMVCRTLMLPALIITGALVTAVSLAGVASTFKAKEKAVEYSKSRA